MKQKYQKPTIEIIEMETEQMMATSVGVSSTSANPAFEGLSKEFDFEGEDW